MKPGTIIRLPDGREGTVVFHGIVGGYGIIWGKQNLTAEEIEIIERGTGDLFAHKVAPGEEHLIPEAYLSEPFEGADLPCVGKEFEIVGAPEDD